MRETRLSGSEGGGTELNRSFLPLQGDSVRRGREMERIPVDHTCGVVIQCNCSACLRATYRELSRASRNRQASGFDHWAIRPAIATPAPRGGCAGGDGPRRCGRPRGCRRRRGGSRRGRMASSIAWQAPWPMSGIMGWAASPTEESGAERSSAAAEAGRRRRCGGCPARRWPRSALLDGGVPAPEQVEQAPLAALRRVALALGDRQGRVPVGPPAAHAPLAEPSATAPGLAGGEPADGRSAGITPARRYSPRSAGAPGEAGPRGRPSGARRRQSAGRRAPRGRRRTAPSRPRARARPRRTRRRRGRRRGPRRRAGRRAARPGAAADEPLGRGVARARPHLQQNPAVRPPERAGLPGDAQARTGSRRPSRSRATTALRQSESPDPTSLISGDRSKTATSIPTRRRAAAVAGRRSPRR